MPEKPRPPEASEAIPRELTAEEEVEKDEYVAALKPALVENQKELERLLADEESNAERISELRENIELLEIQIAEAEENL